eukprot:6482223-Pyramimonas_sp.AAC.1
MVRRPLLSIFSAAHRFIAKAGEAPRPRWPSERRELAWALGGPARRLAGPSHAHGCLRVGPRGVRARFR